MIKYEQYVRQILQKIRKHACSLPVFQCDDKSVQIFQSNADVTSSKVMRCIIATQSP